MKAILDALAELDSAQDCQRLLDACDLWQLAEIERAIEAELPPRALALDAGGYLAGTNPVEMLPQGTFSERQQRLKVAWGQIGDILAATE